MSPLTILYPVLQQFQFYCVPFPQFTIKNSRLLVLLWLCCRLLVPVGLHLFCTNLHSTRLLPLIKPFSKHNTSKVGTAIIKYIYRILSRKHENKYEQMSSEQILVTSDFENRNNRNVLKIKRSAIKFNGSVKTLSGHFLTLIAVVLNFQVKFP